MELHLFVIKVQPKRVCLLTETRWWLSAQLIFFFKFSCSLKLS